MKKILLGIIIGIILCGGIVYAANLYYAKDISYQSSDETWDVTNVNEAINSLYKNCGNKDYYYDLGRKSIYSGASEVYNTTWNDTSVISETATSPTGYGTTTKSISGRTDNIKLLKNPDDVNALLVSVSLNFTISSAGAGSYGDSNLTFYLYDSNDTLLQTWKYTAKGTTTLNITLPDYAIDTDSIYVAYNGYLQANGITDNEIKWVTITSFSVSDSLTLNYK